MAKLHLPTEEIVQQIVDYHGKQDITTADLRDWCDHAHLNLHTVRARLADYKSGRGVYSLGTVQHLEEAYEAPAFESLVPERDDHFVAFGNFKDVKSVLQSRIFYPIFITGLSGNGKTHSVEQSCSQLNRECVRVNITIETDEDDLIGGFRLVNGETVWHDGPVVEALKRGAILLLDEVDLASNKIMCLQSLLEGKGVYLKKVNQYIKPSPGFNVVATANTKGKGDDSGNFIGTNILNEAFLERFAVTFEQDYPSPAVETKILTRIAASHGKLDEEFVGNLVNWAAIIRSTYDDGGVDSVITTRRLINIIKAYAIWDDKMKALELCINRFDDDTKSVFKQLFDKLMLPTPDETNTNTDPESVA